ncbi:unnamed protein product [Symbiodinium sp. CCMP2456]|nr:unnamed protein product [Symbiodinium sp. CCMP2456]
MGSTKHHKATRVTMCIVQPEIYMALMQVRAPAKPAYLKSRETSVVEGCHPMVCSSVYATSDMVVYTEGFKGVVLPPYVLVRSSLWHCFMSKWPAVSHQMTGM